MLLQLQIKFSKANCFDNVYIRHVHHVKKTCRYLNTKVSPVIFESNHVQTFLLLLNHYIFLTLIIISTIAKTTKTKVDDLLETLNLDICLKSTLKTSCKSCWNYDLKKKRQIRRLQISRDLFQLYRKNAFSSQVYLMNQEHSQNLFSSVLRFNYLSFWIILLKTFALSII